MGKIQLACIIDDDPMHVFITKRHIELSGLVDKILICKDGKEAYKTLKTLFNNNEDLPNIIFLDLNMPIWDGWKFLDEFTKIPVNKEVIIYLLTSSISNEDINKSKSYSEVSNYLIKPITQDEILNLLKELLEND
ncbi:MAG: response regulator [Flavobacteriaceae bacterium]|nr:response regulator [Flavobacteriaceae bacterium]